ncbi:histidine phosphatase family protein [Enterococcus rivorum]|uniref:Phosphoglycerate mutase n=2 Tax=Enterococcus rivorum TaxID=762845 RepID=A0A1E5KYG3_9ENTE|nr:histidine phosphatase family protein [Enterococcus rivorum]MBP2099535.1 putative phosphoglycerate mutase [Enterococcus rivorum]OEH82921.1 phosphoglycerate mutase [Enterococcus rivorum]
MVKRKVIAVLMVLFVVLVGCGQTESTKQSSDKATKDEKNETVLYFARHGKTMLNTVDRSQGWIDAPLTPAGVEVAESLGNGLSDVKFDKVYSSDSGRAIETAELILSNNGQKELEITKDKRLREYNFGTYEGMMNEEMLAAVAEYENLTPEEYNNRMKEEGFYKSIKGFADSLSKLDKEKSVEGVNWPAEDSQTIVKRLTTGVDDIVKAAEKSGHKQVLVVSHGMSIITILGELDKTAELPAGGLKNASISKVTYKDGKYKVESVNDMSYVEKGQAK